MKLEAGDMLSEISHAQEDKSWISFLTHGILKVGLEVKAEWWVL